MLCKLLRITLFVLKLSGKQIEQSLTRIATFDLFQHFNINEKIHSSSDGQKFETRFQTINSRYSPKYFGLKKGIVAYTLIANHIPVNARIIGANEHAQPFRL